MLDALAAGGAVTVVSILVKSVAYAATLVCAGTALVLVWLRHIPEAEAGFLRRLAVASACVAGLAALARLPVRAGFLMGGSWEGAFDPILLSLVAQGPLGLSVAVRLAGVICLVVALAVRARMPAKVFRAFLSFGALVTAASFALRGHALNEPQWLMTVLVTAHLLGLSFWVGIFAPLSRMAARSPVAAGTLAEEFGSKAIWMVGLLAAAGGAMLVVLGVATPGALETTYGRLFAIKLAVFLSVLALAALNKVRLAPALVAASDHRFEGSALRAAAGLRRSVLIEAALIGTILVITATLTTISAPAAG